MEGLPIELDQGLLEAFCEKHHIRRLAFFGSVLRADFRPGSDIDVLVEFEPGHTPGLSFFSIQQELSNLLGKQVDLNTPMWLSPRFRERVLAEARVGYVRGYGENIQTSANLSF